MLCVAVMFNLHEYKNFDINLKSILMALSYFKQNGIDITKVHNSLLPIDNNVSFIVLL